VAAKKAKRDYKAAYARRDARARALGFSSYYDQRVRKGRLSAPRPTGAALRRARGHAGGRDLVGAAGEGDIVIAGNAIRDSRGRFKQIDLSLVDANDGSEREFTLSGRQLSKAYLMKLVEDLEAKGVIFNYSYDLRKLVTEVEAE
jgi:hypothetical protein